MRKFTRFIFWLCIAIIVGFFWFCITALSPLAEHAVSVGVVTGGLALFLVGGLCCAAGSGCGDD